MIKKREFMQYLLSCLIGYLLGSIPTAYILLKKTKGLDITKVGTGNVGAMNSYEVTNSKLIGFLVFFIDALKGLLSVYLCLLIFSSDFVFPGLALIFAVFSHSYNPWLKFKGGRGLAAAAGGGALIFPFMIILWLVLWIVIYLVKKDIIFANIWALIATFIIILTSSNIAVKYAFPEPDSISTLILFTTGILMLVFIKHIEPLKELIHIDSVQNNIDKKDSKNE